MRLFILAILLALLIWSIIDPILRLKTKPSYFWVISLTILLLANGFAELRWQLHQNKASEIVQIVSKKQDAKVDCQRISEAFFDAQITTFGFVEWNERNIAHLSYSTCKDFMSFMDSSKTTSSPEEVRAVAVLLHEAYHVKGIDNEAETECNSQKVLKEILIDLGVSESYSEEYAERYIENSKTQLESQYQNGKC